MKNVTPYSLDDEAVRSDAAVSVISSIGLTAVIVWADLLGHGFGFAPSSSIIQQLGNARLFFLVGFTLCAIGSVLLRELHKENAGADKGGSDSRFPWNRTIRLRLPANGATVGDHRASGTRLLRRRILRDDFAHIANSQNETPRHGNRSLISELDSQNDRRLGVKHGSDLVGTSGFCFDSALGLLRVPGGAQALRHITLSRSIPLSPTFNEKRYVRPRVSASSRIVDTGGSERHQPSWTLGKQPFGIACLNSGRLPHSRPRFDCLRIPHPASQQQ